MMKLILATLAACAFAAQDTTPPVISLTLSGVSPDHRAVGGVRSGYSTRRAYHSMPNTTDYSTSAATECVVKSNVQDCPEPVCEAHDHHDSSVKCNEPMLFQIYQHEGAETPLKKVFDARAEEGKDFIQCKDSFDPTVSGTNCIDTAQRNYMAQWLLTYTASDASDNHAEHVTFSFVFVDLFAPSFDFRTERDIDYKFGFEEHQTWGDIDGRFTGNLRDHTYAPFDGKKSFGRFCAPNDDTCKDSGTEASSTTWAAYDGDFDGSLFNLDSSAKIESKHYELVAGNLDVDRYGALQTGSENDYKELLGRKSKQHTQYHMRHHAIAVDMDRPSGDDYTDALPTVYWRQNGAKGANGAAKWSSGNTADLDTLTTLGTSVVVMDFTVTDNTGRFGFEGTNNKNLHRLEFHFYDAIKPKIYLACYESSFAMNNESTADGLGGNSSLEIHYADVYEDEHRRQFGRGVVAGEDACNTRSCAQKHAKATCSDKVDGAIDICADASGDDHGCKWEDPNDEIVLECGSDYTHTNKRVIDAYHEPGAYLIDNVDSWDENLIDADYRQPQKVNKTFDEGGHLTIEYHELDSSGTPTVIKEAEMKTDKETRYTVKYTGSDGAGLVAAPVTRNVKVVDRSAPRITLVGDHTIQNSAGSDTQTLEGYNPAFEDEACKSEPMVNGSYVEGCFNHEDYKKRGYLCKDECTLKDNLQTTAELYQFSSDFTGEGGSACDEAGHNVLAKTEANGRTELTGDWTFPEYRTGIYAIVYTCKDEAGNSATVCRTIENVDHTKPIIQILGSDKMQLEATHQGNYIDDGATCSDQVDGVISQNVEVSGDVVNLSKVGTYTIMYNCKDAANRPAVQAVRTVVVSQTSCPTCAMECYSSAGTEDIDGEEVERNPKDDEGNPIPKLVNDAGQVVATGSPDATGKRYYCIQPHEASFQYTDAGATCSDVIDGNTPVECQLSFDGNEETSPSTCDRDLVKANKIGTYVITYKSENSVGKSNDERSCRGGFTEYVRSVLVQDTLRPVITLKYDGKKVAQGTEEAQSSALGHGQTHNADFAALAEHNELLDQTNKKHSATTYTEDSALEQGNAWAPTSGADGADALMAEEATTSGVNGWVLGAIASAVTGLALLGYSQRKTTVATSVPV